MTDAVSGVNERYITVEFCPGQKPSWQCNDVFTRSFFTKADPLKHIFNCAKTVTKCDDKKATSLKLSYDPRFYHRSLFYVLNTLYNLSFLQDMLMIPEVLGWLDITSYFTFLVFWVAVLVYDIYTSQNSKSVTIWSRNAEMLTQGFDHQSEMEQIAPQLPKNVVEKNAPLHPTETRNGPTVSTLEKCQSLSNNCHVLSYRILRH